MTTGTPTPPEEGGKKKQEKGLGKQSRKAAQSQAKGRGQGQATDRIARNAPPGTNPADIEAAKKKRGSAKEEGKPNLHLVEEGSTPAGVRLPSPEQIADIFPGAPVGDSGVMTGPGCVEDGDRIFYVTKKFTVARGEELVYKLAAECPVFLAGRLRDASAEMQYLVLYFREDGEGGEWRRIIIPRGDTKRRNELLKYADDGYPVDGNIVEAHIDMLRETVSQNIAVAQCLPTASITEKMGWQDDMKACMIGETMLRAGAKATEQDVSKLHPYEWAEDAISFRALDEGENQIAKGFAVGGTFEGWRETIAKIEFHERVKFVLYAAFASLILVILKVDGFGLDNSGGTSTGKTTTLRIAASPLGRPSESEENGIIYNLNATNVGPERLAAVSQHLPLFLDETQLANPEILAKALYMLPSGKSRLRGTPKGLQKSATWRLVSIFTGERPAVSFSEAGGTRARILTLYGSPFQNFQGIGKTVDEINEGVRQNYGHAGRMFVQYLLDNRDKWDEWRDLYKDTRARFKEMVSADMKGVAGRVAGHLATIDVAAKLVHEAVDMPFAYSGTVENLFSTVIGETDSADRAKVALGYVYSWAASNADKFAGRRAADASPATPHNGWAGRWDDKVDWEFIAVNEETLQRILSQHDMKVAEITPRWKESGFLITDKRTTDKKFQRLPGTKLSLSLWTIKREAFNLPEDREDEADAADVVDS